MAIMGDNADEAVEVTEGLKAVEMEVTLITGMINKSQEPAAVRDNTTFNIIEGVDKIHFEVNDDNGMQMTLIIVTEIIGTEIPTIKVVPTGVEDGIIIIGVKDIVIEVEGEDGILINNITIQGIKSSPNFQTQITIVHHLWDTNTGTQSHMSNTRIPNNSNNNTNLKCRQPHLNKLQIFVSCVIVKAIMIINANLQVTLWPTHKKPSIKADHTATKTLIMGNGHKATMTTMTLTGNLFSSGGSRCR